MRSSLAKGNELVADVVTGQIGRLPRGYLQVAELGQSLSDAAEPQRADR